MPPELTGGSDTREEMVAALFLAIEEKPDGVFLYRYDAQGECVGDTWHMSVDDAKEQANYEYGSEVLNWQSTPQDIQNIAEYVLMWLESHPIENQ
jgi:hypothetical protein